MDDVENKNNENVAGPVSPGVVDVMGSNKSIKNSEQKKKKTKGFFRKKNLNRIFTGLIFVVTAFYTIFSYLQWKTMKDALKISDSSNVHTREGVYIANESLKLSRENAYIENRAWIGLVEKPQSHGFLEDLKLELKNFGKTPADSVYFGSKCFEYWGQSLKNISLIWTSLGIISPSEVAKVTIESPKYANPDSVSVLLGKGKIRFYYYGVVVYRDNYGKYDTTEFSLLLRHKYFTELETGSINRMK